MQLKTSIRAVNGIMIVDCQGKVLFGDESSLLRDQVKNLLPNNKKIVINLAEVTYIDSGGLGTLVGLFTSARNAGADIKLANLHKRIFDLLQVTKLLTIFEVYDSEAKAVKSFAQAARA